MQLKKTDIEVDTSTWARGSQYQKGHRDNFVPKPKKLKTYSIYISSLVRVVERIARRSVVPAILMSRKTAAPTKIEPRTAQPKKKSEASTQPRALVDKYITKKITKISSSYKT